MSSIDQKANPVGDLGELITRGEVGPIAEFLRVLPPEETAWTISHLDDDLRTDMFSALAMSEPEFAADLMEHFDDAHAAEIVAELTPEAAAAIVDEMDSDEQADVLSVLPDVDAEAILGEMSPEEAIDTRRRMRYEDDTAGGLMITEYLAYSGSRPVEEVASDLREHSELYAEFEVRYVYALHLNGQLEGVVPMRQLVMAKRGTPLGHLADPVRHVVNVDAHVDELEDLFDRIDFSAVPVIDEADKLVGVVQRAAVQEARSEQAESDLAKFGGIVRGEELRSMPVINRSLRRLAYLVPLAGLALVSASVIKLFITTVEQVPVLAMFLPVVSGICGSGGGQAVAVSMREISLGLIKPSDLKLVMMKEASVAAIDGVVLGLLLCVLIWVWQGNLFLGLVVGGSLPIVLVVAKCAGGTVPLMLRKAGMDPAMASTPAVSTVVDVVGFLVVLGFATAALSQLVPSGS